MLVNYIVGAVGQLEERIRQLRLSIPRNLPRDYDSLALRCRDELDVLLQALTCVRDDEVLRRPEFMTQRIRQLKRAVSRLDYIECVGIAALERVHKHDHRLNRLLDQAAREIRYPLTTPVVTTLSRDYFHINPSLNLLSVPLVEGRFLLHLPDLYHELAHPLLVARTEPAVEGFGQGFEHALGAVLEHLLGEIKKAERGRGPEIERFRLRVWQASWVQGWLAEFFCDLFAAAVIGPAYAWSNLHLSMLRGGPPFAVPTHAPTSHPSDDARMRAVLLLLRSQGFATEADSITTKWEQATQATGEKAEPEYRRCFPDSLLQKLVEQAVMGVAAMDCRLATRGTTDTIYAILNEAWSRFWSEPAQYPAWEQDAVASLMDAASRGDVIDSDENHHRTGRV